MSHTEMLRYPRLSKARAQGLQRCSTSSCVICGAQGRLLCDATIQRWGPSHDGITVRYDHDGYATARVGTQSVCRKHADRIGVAIVFIGPHGQFNLVRIVRNARGEALTDEDVSK